jgi:hypothetical protein
MYIDNFKSTKIFKNIHILKNFHLEFRVVYCFLQKTKIINKQMYINIIKEIFH